MTMALLQAEWLPDVSASGWTTRSPGSSPWPSGVGSARCIGALQGFIIAYIGVPSFIVTLGGLLV